MHGPQVYGICQTCYGATSVLKWVECANTFSPGPLIHLLFSAPGTADICLAELVEKCQQKFTINIYHLSFIIKNLDFAKLSSNWQFKSITDTLEGKVQQRFW